MRRPAAFVLYCARSFDSSQLQARLEGPPDTYDMADWRLTADEWRTATEQALRIRQETDDA